jgi:hypothetical protein
MPVDGDPSDPVGQRPLEVLRSARPHDEPTATVVYDGDPQTVWTPHADADETWLWLDLGVERRLREVRVLAQGSGTAEIALSSDRRQWRDVDQIDVGGGWQELEMRDDARYVRLTLLPTDDGGDLPAIAEVALYGSDRSRSVSSERQVSSGRDRQSRGDRKSAAEQKAESADASGRNEGRREPRSKDRVQTSVEPGGTRCRGDRGPCEARQGRVSMEDDCERERTCAVDVRVDGGTAGCDAVGSDETKAGDGEGRRAGEGGLCEADANGGAVAIGDVNP